jgi:hypothetical protein
MGLSFEQAAKIVELAALVSGGFWAVYTFYKLQKVRTENLNIEQAVLKIQKDRQEFLRKQPLLSIDLKATETGALPAAAGNCLHVTAILKNEGEQNLGMTFEDSVLIVGRINFGKHKDQTFQIVHRCKAVYFTDRNDQALVIPERVFRIGQRRQMEFVVPVVEPGFYMIQFQAVYYRRPFEGERKSVKDPEPILAFEQIVCAATAEVSKLDVHSRKSVGL